MRQKLIDDKCNIFSDDEGMPLKMDGTQKNPCV